MRKVWAIGAAVALLAGCGGDDAPAPGNGGSPPPVFGNASYDVNYAENGTTPVISLTVTSSGTANLVLTLAGADRALFAIQNARDLVFIAPPDFETPRDAGANNVYNVTVIATDAQGRSSAVDVTVTVTDIATAMRFVDPVFDTATSLGTMSVPAAAGVVPVAFIGPMGDTLAARPLVLLGSQDRGDLAALAQGLAVRGYVVGILGEASPADLLAAANAFATGSFPGLGIDRQAIGITAVGDEAWLAALAQQLEGSDFAFAGLPNASAGAQEPASSLYAQLVAGGTQ